MQELRLGRGGKTQKVTCTYTAKGNILLLWRLLSLLDAQFIPQ